jgi:hypothetical protein
MELKEKLKELEAKEETLSEELYNVKNEIKDTMRQIWREETGITEGDRVVFMDGKVTKTGKLVGMEVGYNTIYPMVKVDKKDGSPGERITRVYQTITKL